MMKPLATERPDRFLQSALLYAKWGRPVLPLQPRGKTPLTTHGVLDATTDPATIRAWWTKWPDANVGGATGVKSGWVALDVDPRHGGDDALAELEAEYGQLPETPRNLTGGGGEQILFKHPGGIIRNSAGTIGRGLDTRGDGGYIVLPPSIHPNGRPYTWDAGTHPADTPLADMPDWLLAKLTARQSAPAANCTPDQPIAEGSRNATLTSLAGKLRRAGFHPDEIAGLLLVANRRRCDPPLPDTEVETIAASVGRYPPAETPIPPIPPAAECSGNCKTANDLRATVRALRDIAENPGLKSGPKLTGIVTVFEMQSRADQETGFAKMNLAPIARGTGQSVATVSNHIKGLAEAGVFEKYRSTAYDKGAFHSFLHLKPALADAGPVATAVAFAPLAAVQVGPRGKAVPKPHTCGNCGEAAGTTRTRQIYTNIYCNGCGECLTPEAPIVTDLPNVVTVGRLSPGGEFKVFEFTSQTDDITNMFETKPLSDNQTGEFKDFEFTTEHESSESPTSWVSGNHSLSDNQTGEFKDFEFTSTPAGNLADLAAEFADSDLDPTHNAPPGRAP